MTLPILFTRNLILRPAERQDFEGWAAFHADEDTMRYLGGTQVRSVAWRGLCTFAGARAAIEAAGHAHETITVPGALEVPGAIALAAESGRYEAFVALGVVIRGETYHFEIVAGESARALMALTLDGLAIGNGILTVENEDQALARARPDDKDKGGEAAKAALAMMALKARFAA